MHKVSMLVGSFVLCVLMAAPAEANGAKRKKSYAVERQVVRVYEPRPAPVAPLVALGVLGTNLIVWDDLEVDLYDDGNPPPRVRRIYESRRYARRR